MSRMMRMMRESRNLLIAGAVLTVTTVFAQTTQTPPKTPPATQTPPLLPKADDKPAKPAPTPFPAESKVAYISLAQIFSDSNIGKKGLEQLKSLNDRLQAGLAARDKEIQGLSDKIKSQSGLVAITTQQQWAKELTGKQREAQFAQQDAQAQVDELQQDLLEQFRATVAPVVEAVRKDKGLFIIFALETEAAGGLSIAAAHPGVDLSQEIVTRLNAMKSN